MAAVKHLLRIFLFTAILLGVTAFLYLVVEYWIQGYALGPSALTITRTLSDIRTVVVYVSLMSMIVGGVYVILYGLEKMWGR